LALYILENQLYYNCNAPCERRLLPVLTMKFYAVLLIILCISTTYAQDGSVLQAEIEKAMTYEVDMDTSKTTGWVIGCIDHDSSWVFGYGRISKQLPLKPDGNTQFEIGGVSKVFTGAVVHKMVETQVLHYDSTVNTYLKPAQRFPLGNKLTILQLMTHTSGLPKLPEDFGMSEYTQDQPYVTYTEGGLFESLKQLDTTYIKVGKYQYSHINHAVLEVIIKNKGYYADLTKFGNHQADTLHSYVQGYNPGQRPVSNWLFGETFHYSLGMKSSVNEIMDLLKVQMSLKDSLYYKSIGETQKALFKTDVDKSTSVGKIWHVLKVKKDVFVCIQSGSTNGQSAFVACMPQTKTAVVVLANTRMVQGKLGMMILRMLNFNWRRNN
jgi:serine-type D-Ala-D-Ala carboxypeptidase/endopeptidase